MKKLFVSAAVALWLPIWIIGAGNPPEMKEGLWSVHKQSMQNPGNKKTDSTSTICRSHAYDQHALSLTKNVKGCTMVSESFQSGKRNQEMRCVMGATVVVSKGTSTYQGDTAAHSETHATYTPPMAGISEMTMIMDQKYVGSCPVGMQPGDMTTPDGRVAHLWQH